MQLEHFAADLPALVTWEMRRRLSGVEIETTSTIDGDMLHARYRIKPKTGGRPEVVMADAYSRYEIGMVDNPHDFATKIVGKLLDDANDVFMDGN